ncbi:RimK family protein [Azospirillum rugosum]|uniref:Glutathione synthase/RimK-type ligase-like ATP-grasp enzyme n=1 Tax=Azospirillum rugosum TaxID=416170 RepID=A0ABS4SF96_9PROT|nr:RimK family protein [Azospirillum rugosum]MBP2290617.1 glutathione synthase/RimK-type ligase-like ATP-grasp enzyme [Azospirillum rugosum]MDQ0525505.1 glutathione synthase/RimK-type ligase-like ATP-grasp enzyme [Azospirillum rugosum]
MPAHLLIVDRRADLKWAKDTLQVVSARDYIAKPETVKIPRGARILNLSRSHRYLGTGYYCSLLAEARGERVIPSVKTILDLSQKDFYRAQLGEVNEALRRTIKRLSDPPGASFNLTVFFGQADDARFQDIARSIFDLFRCPLLKVQVRLKETWTVHTLEALSLADLRPDQEAQFEAALEAYTRASWREPAARAPARYTLAILHNPREELPPSSPRALQKFVKAGESLGIAVELIEKKDYLRLAEFDALFIRETTNLDHHTYRFAKKAAAEGMPVIDDPNSILKCTNKVYLAELLKANRIPAPKTVIFDKRGLATLDQEIPYPIVLKIPDGSFSRGVFKVQNRSELEATAEGLFEQSDVILAQEFMYTEFDWRIGVLNRQPIYVCQYLMAKKHWQIVKHGGNGRAEQGSSRTLAVEEAPPEVIDIAVKAAGLIGDGLYGVDLKQNDRGVFVIEINDNPSIDLGVEDAKLKDELYRLVMRDFLRRLESRPKK